MSDAPSRQPGESASGSSFYLAMRVLPRAQRRAMFDIYGFCRAVDDIADGKGSREARLQELDRWRSDITALFNGARPGPLNDLAQTIQRFGLHRDDFLSIIEGMEMDVRSDMSAPDSATLDLYCDRVASAVGRLCVLVFGVGGDDGARLAFHLGRALQLTNILRDLDEDAQKARLYLPREALLRAGIAKADAVTVLNDPALHEACATIVHRARGHFAEADTVMSRYALRTVRAPMLMSKVYQHMLRQMVARGWNAPRRRISIGRATLAWILLRYGLF